MDSHIKIEFVALPVIIIHIPEILAQGMRALYTTSISSDTFLNVSWEYPRYRDGRVEYPSGGQTFESGYHCRDRRR